MLSIRHNTPILATTAMVAFSVCWLMGFAVWVFVLLLALGFRPRFLARTIDIAPVPGQVREALTLWLVVFIGLPGNVQTMVLLFVLAVLVIVGWIGWAILRSPTTSHETDIDGRG